jgi:hypothetical protein
MKMTMMLLKTKRRSNLNLKLLNKASKHPTTTTMAMLRMTTIHVNGTSIASFAKTVAM